MDYLNGIERAKREIALHEHPAVSSVTWMEVLVGAASMDEEVQIRAFLTGFEVLPVDGQVAEKAVELRRRHRMRLPDAIIWATAICHTVLLVTRNTRDFPADHPSVRIPYRL